MTEQKQKSDLSRAFSEDGELKTHVGGQALLEGIMMRGKYNWAVAVREPEGTVYTEEHDLASGKDKNGWLYWPFVRGCRAFVESLALGYKALSIAAEHAFVEEEEVEEDSSGSAEGRSQAAVTQAASGTLDSPADRPLDNADTKSAPLQADEQRDFSWKDDFGNPDEMIDALCAQRSLEVIDGDTGRPVVYAQATDETREGGNEGPAFEDPKASAECADGSAAESAQAGNEPADGAAIKPTVAAAGPGAAVAESANDAAAESASSTATDSAGTATTDPGVAASVAMPVAADEPAPATEKKPLLGDKEMAISMVLGLVLGVALFVVAPAFITNLIVGEYDDKTLLWNIVDGILRICVFVFYIWLIGRMSDIKRMFGYHGAEHKTIHCFEHGLPLTPENARSFPRLHVRCGTAFLIMVMIIAIFVYTITPVGALIEAWGVSDGIPKLVLVIIVRILLMPLIAGIAYEITVKWAGSHPDNPLVKVILWPGMQMQYLTTREPDDGQIECAIEAMKLVLEREEREEALASATA